MMFAIGLAMYFSNGMFHLGSCGYYVVISDVVTSQKLKNNIIADGTK